MPEATYDTENGGVTIACVNANWATWAFYQDVTDLPKGVYSLTVEYVVGESNRNSIFLEGSRGRADGNMNVYWSPQTISSLLVLDGKVRIGANYYKTDKDYTVTFKKFTLMQVSDGLKETTALYNADKEQITLLKDNLTNSTKAAVEKVINEASLNTIDDAVAAYSGLHALLPSAQTEASAVKSLKEKLAEVKSFVSSHTLAEGTAKTALEQAVSEAETWNTKTSVDAINTLSSNLATACQNILISGVQPNANETFDVTFVLGNPTCSVNEAENSRSWIRGAGNAAAGYIVNRDGITGVEFWKNEADANAPKNQDLIYQTVNNLPEGEYRISAKAFGVNQAYNKGFINGGNEGTLYLKANEGHAYVTGNVWQDVTVRGYVGTDGVLKVALATEGNDNLNNWVAISSCTVQYTGAHTVTEYAAELDAVEAEAQKLFEILPDACCAAASAKTDRTGLSTENDWLNAIGGKNQEIAVANALTDVKSAYAAWTEWSAYAERMKESMTVVQDENSVSALDAVVNAQKEAVEKATDVSPINDAIAALKPACVVYAAQAEPVSGERFDVSRLYLVNPDVKGLPKQAVSGLGWVSATNSWSNNFQNNNNPSEFLESYKGDGPFGEGWALYQEVADVPAGSYIVKLDAFGQNANNVNGTNENTQLYFYAGDVKGDVLTREKALTEMSLAYVQAETGSVRIGIKAEANNGSNWTACNNMRLYKMASTLELAEDKEYNVVVGSYANVTLARTLKGGKWNTFCVPFDMEKGETFTEVKKLTGASTSGETTTLTFEDAESIEAGVPYIVKVGESDVKKLAVNGVTVKAAAPGETAVKVADESGNTVTMIGNYTTKTIKDGEFFISNDAFYVADQPVTVKGYRAYITMEAAASGENNVNRMLIDIDGEVTAIEEVLGNEVTSADKSADVYTLSGVRVKSGVKADEALEGLAKGIYIVNGKKVIK